MFVYITFLRPNEKHRNRICNNYISFYIESRNNAVCTCVITSNKLNNKTASIVVTSIGVSDARFQNLVYSFTTFQCVFIETRLFSAETFAYLFRDRINIRSSLRRVQRKRGKRFELYDDMAFSIQYKRLLFITVHINKFLCTFSLYIERL